jgi:hypothetical protein
MATNYIFTDTCLENLEPLQAWILLLHLVSVTLILEAMLPVYEADEAVVVVYQLNNWPICELVHTE